MRVAILGASGHIAKNITSKMFYHTQYELCLFSRSPNQVKLFDDQLRVAERVKVLPYEHFKLHEYDVVINGVGIGDPGALKQQLSMILRLTEAYDNLILDYLLTYPETLYINLSSGAAYGSSFNKPAGLETRSDYAIDLITNNEYYSIAKFYSEVKHRSLSHLNIIDLRIFGFFSKYIDLNSHFLLSEIVRTIRSNGVFVTNDVNFVRDYAHPADLFQLIELCIQRKGVNKAYDVYSRAPVTKFELLYALEQRFKLKYQIYEQEGEVSVTGIKSNYYSQNLSAQELGYAPRYTSFEGIQEVITSIIDEADNHEEN